MDVQLLIATMYQDDYQLLEKMNLQSNAIVINQCDNCSRQVVNYKGYEVIWINTTERGLSRSRNMALYNATAEVCILCDDDEVLSDAYPDMVKSAYANLKNVDIVVFNIQGSIVKERLFHKPKKVSGYKTYGSVHLTFRREKILEAGISFNPSFGTGSNKYLSGEDSIFCRECKKNGLLMYTYPGVLCRVSYEKSTWFEGYNNQYFYDIGAYLSVVFPHTKNIVKWYYPMRFYKLSDLTARNIIRDINCGMQGFLENINYKEFRSKYQNESI